MFIHGDPRNRRSRFESFLLYRRSIPVILLALCMAALAAFFLGAQAQKSGQLAGYGELLANPWRAARSFVNARVTSPVEPQRLTIDLKFKHYNRLLTKRAEALETGWLMRSENDTVPIRRDVAQAVIHKRPFLATGRGD